MNSDQGAILRTIVDGDSDVFRYGLYKYDDSEFEDPTYLGFTIEIDDQTALFNQVKPFLEKQSITRTEHLTRLPVYDEFISKIVQIFKSQESVESQDKKGVYIKSHYINSITGLDNINKKFIKWRTDKLTVELYEDISMFSTYLTYLYNNLTYSYENGRALIPENLLKFNLHIKISEIRNLTSLQRLKSTNATDLQIADALKNNITCVIYKLYDCQFDFFGSNAHGDSITQSGINTTVGGNGPAVLSFDIYYKSVSRQIFNPLIKKAISMNDNKVDLDLVIVGGTGERNNTGQLNNPSASTTNPDNNNNPTQQYSSDVVNKRRDNIQQSFTAANNSKKYSDISTIDSEFNNFDIDISPDFGMVEKQKQLKDLKDYNEPLAPETFENKNIDSPDNVNPSNPNLLQVGGLSNLANKVIKSVEHSVKNELNMAVTLLKQKRNELVRNFVADVSKQVGIKKIVPDNVYTDSNFFQNALDQLKSDVGTNIGDAILGTITHN